MTSPDGVSITQLISSNQLLIFIAFFGGVVLFGMKMAEHFSRKPENKFSNGRYFLYFVFLLVSLPILGSAVVIIYLANGDKISPVLAFQIGLTSPAIVQSLIIAAANKFKEGGLETTSGQ
ncbi:hypothetical protein [Methylomarinum vadi]|uniref:hypothetical protein n=1 Tax=Methylomarinum vadi TaxID=438855 RepID=UPI0004DF05D5|nr:hypothetical protein [Methylomarinum vadi]